MKTSVAAGLIVLVWSTAIGAQQTLVGKWGGKLSERGGRDIRQTNVTMEITSAENGKLKGTMSLFPMGRRGCKGQYVLEGTFADNKVELKSSKGEVFCDMQFQLVAESNTLKGTTADGEIELTKQ